MRVHSSARAAVLSTSLARISSAFGVSPSKIRSGGTAADASYSCFFGVPNDPTLHSSTFSGLTRRTMVASVGSGDGGGGGGGGNDDDRPSIAQIGKLELREILEDIKNGGREESGYVVIDVREEEEVAATGPISPHAHTLPLPLIAQRGALNLPVAEFEAYFGFEKPRPDETIVFSCKAGIRSQYAAQYAAMSGYTNLINYAGGANDWFSPSDDDGGF